MERDGELRTGTTPLSKRAVGKIVRENVKPDACIMTDEHGAFNDLSVDYYHYRVRHSGGEYAKFDWWHSNGIESVWALFKRQIIGRHHYLSPKHLDRYLGEMTWRFNERKTGEGDRVNALLARTSGRLTYKALTT